MAHSVMSFCPCFNYKYNYVVSLFNRISFLSEQWYHITDVLYVRVKYLSLNIVQKYQSLPSVFIGRHFSFNIDKSCIISVC